MMKFTYYCPECLTEFEAEVFLLMSGGCDPETVKCPECGKEVDAEQ